MQSTFFRRISAGLAALVSIAALGLSAAQAAYPEKPIKLVVPFSAGGGADLIARTLAVELAKELGQPVIVENKPGAGTIIGSDLVAKSAPDGYTLLVSSIAHSVNPTLVDKLPYATERDFMPVAMTVRSPNVLVVRGDSPFKTVKDIVEAAKANPNKLTYASPGNGTSSHLAGALFEDLAKVRLQHVAYKGSAQALRARRARSNTASSLMSSPTNVAAQPAPRSRPTACRWSSAAPRRCRSRRTTASIRKP